ncbi:MAG: TspO/MBR family protein [Planctomycetota bacterium]|jgi:tryptophan-rich sensory protein
MITKQSMPITTYNAANPLGADRYQLDAPSRLDSVFSLGFWVVVCFVPSVFSALFPVDSWYAQLDKPAFTPPAWLFGPVWTVLYTLMAVSIWRIWETRADSGVTWPIRIFLVQLGVNALWTPAFFGLHRPDIAFGVIVFLWISIFATMIVFYRHNKFAATLLLPYLLWVSFASVLNATLAHMN